MNMNGKHKTSAFLMTITIIAMLSLPTCYGIPIKHRKEKLDMDNCINNRIIVLDGNITADVDNSKLRIVRPSINLIDGQPINFNATETNNGKYLIDKTLRINIDIINDADGDTLLGRYVTTCIILLKKDRPLISALKGMFTEKVLNVNRTNVFSEGEKYIVVPLLYETEEKSENMVMYIIAIGTILGVASKGQPIIAHEKVDLEFIYLSDNPQDTTAPVTICILDGEQIEKTTSVFLYILE